MKYVYLTFLIIVFVLLQDNFTKQSRETITALSGPSKNVN